MKESQTVSLVDGLMNPELRERASKWSAAKRISMADTFELWAKQLRVSADVLKLQNHPKKNDGDGNGGGE